MYRHKSHAKELGRYERAALGGIIGAQRGDRTGDQLSHRGLELGRYRLAGHGGPQQQDELVVTGGVLPPVDEHPDQQLAAVPGRDRTQVGYLEFGGGRGGEQPGLRPEVAPGSRPRPSHSRGRAA